MASHPGATQARNLRIGLQSLNGNLLCAIKISKTANNLEKGQIWKLCILPLNCVFEPHKDFRFFYTAMRPSNYPTCVEADDIDVNLPDFTKEMNMSLPDDRILDLFIDWFEKLQLDLGKKIVPLVHDWHNTKMFLMKWLGQDLFDSVFHHEARDIMTCALFLNDRADVGSRPIPYTRVKMTNVCSKHNIHFSKFTDSMEYCLHLAKLYNELCRACGIF